MWLLVLLAFILYGVLFVYHEYSSKKRNTRENHVIVDKSGNVLHIVPFIVSKGSNG